MEHSQFYDCSHSIILFRLSCTVKAAKEENQSVPQSIWTVSAEQPLALTRDFNNLVRKTKEGDKRAASSLLSLSCVMTYFGIYFIHNSVVPRRSNKPVQIPTFHLISEIK